MAVTYSVYGTYADATVSKVSARSIKIYESFTYNSHNALIYSTYSISQRITYSSYNITYGRVMSFTSSTTRWYNDHGYNTIGFTVLATNHNGKSYVSQYSYSYTTTNNGRITHYQTKTVSYVSIAYGVQNDRSIYINTIYNTYNQYRTGYNINTSKDTGYTTYHETIKNTTNYGHYYASTINLVSINTDYFTQSYQW